MIKILRKFLWPHIAFALKIPTPNFSIDRTFLENKIFQFLNKISKPKENLLFIGVAPYTRHYYSMLNYNVITLDFEKKFRKFGNGSNHIVGSATEMDKFFTDEFNVIIANGLVGYGLVGKTDFNKMLKMCHSCLKEEGIVILGYNDNKDHLDFTIKKVSAYKLFDEFVPRIKNLKTPSIKVNQKNDHTFLFLKKRKKIEKF